MREKTPYELNEDKKYRNFVASSRLEGIVLPDIPSGESLENVIKRHKNPKKKQE